MPGGNPPHFALDGWYVSDENGRNLERVSTIPAGRWLWQKMNLNQPLEFAVLPDNYFVLLSEESSEALTRDFEFNLSDGTSILKSVTANSSGSITLNESAGDLYKLFHWTGTDVVVLSKVY